MTKFKKNTIKIDDYKTVKILKKDITKRILACFNEESKTASEIANSISFPKDKIYYHIKNLLSNNILFIESTQMVKGIEQKRFLPTAKTFTTIDRTKTIQEPVTVPINEKDKADNKKITEFDFVHFKKNRNIKERRRNSNRRIYTRRNIKIRRVAKDAKYKGQENRIKKERRNNQERRVYHKRRNQNERRLSNTKSKPIIKRSDKKSQNEQKHHSLFYKNTILNLNGIKECMSFIQSGNHVTFLFCKLNKNGFMIKKTHNYDFPIKIKGYQINNLSDLIINIFQQFIHPNKKRKIYLAIQSDHYNCEMTYLASKGKSHKLFKKNLLNILKQSYNIDNTKSIVDYIRYDEQHKNAIVSYSTKKKAIEKDFNVLLDSGLQLRHVAVIPKILHNVYTYYNLDKINEFSLLIYIGKLKTHLVVCYGNRLIESCDFPKGLNYFLDNIIELTNLKNNAKDKFDDAMHFLSFYGFKAEIHNASSNQRKHYKEAIAITDHNMFGFIQRIKDLIIEFENSLSHVGFVYSLINKVYISGPGSHIKNIDTAITNGLKIKVDNLSNIVETHLVSKDNAGPLSFSAINKSNLFRKKENSKSTLKTLKQKIINHEKAIESTQSPESAKYSLARLDIEKNSKIKSIDEANKKLINTSKDFKILKNDYKKSQKELHSNIKALNEKLDIYSEKLFENYKEHEEVNKRISELEYESDSQKQKKIKQELSQKNNNGNDIKTAAQNRALLNDQKENFESEIDKLEQKIIKHQELFQKYSIQLSHGHDEIAEFEYLHESLKNIAGAFKRSFLEHMETVGDIGKDDIYTLQQAGYLIAKNTKRIDQIRDSFKNSVNGDTKDLEEKFIDGEIAIEIREKLIKILDLIIKVPENLIHLKNQSEVIVKINNDLKLIANDKEHLENEIKKSKLNKKEKEQAIVALKKNIDVQENDLKAKEKIRLENIDILKYVHDSIEVNDELEHHTNLLKEIRPRKQLKKKMLDEISSNINITEKSIDRNEKIYSQLESKQLDGEKIYLKNQKEIDNQNNIKSKNKTDIINQIDLFDKEETDTINQISNAELYIEKLEKECITKKDEIDNIKKELFPIMKKSQERKESIIKEFDKRLRQLDKEQVLRISRVKKTKNTTIKTFFKQEEKKLKKEVIVNKKQLEKLKKAKEKILSDRNLIRISLSKQKKVKTPKIAILKKQLTTLEKDLKGGRRIQDRLDLLESKKKDWDELFKIEQSNYNSVVIDLEKTIKRKKSPEYHSFLQSGLDRFDKVGDNQVIAKNMAEESISMDLREIEKYGNAFNRFKQRHNNFMLRYKRSHKTILEKLKPFGGKKKNILAKIEKFTTKIKYEESIIQKWIEKLDKKNEQLIAIEKEYLKLKEDTVNNLKNLKFEIKNIPIKKAKALEQAEREMLQIPKDIAKEKSDVVLEKEERLHNFNIDLAHHTLATNLNQAEDKILFYFREIEQSKTQIHTCNQLLKKIRKSKISSESKLEIILKDLDKIKLNIGKSEDIFNEKKVVSEEKIDANRNEYSDLNKKLENLKSEKYEILKDLTKIEEDYNTSVKYQKELKATVNEQDRMVNKKNLKKIKSISVNERRRDLYQYEKDLKINIKRIEQSILELNRFIDTLRNDQSELMSEISLIENDNVLFERDYQRYEKLIIDNKNHLDRLSVDHYKTLNNFLKIKNLYPSYRVIINERIANVYSIIELKIKDKDGVESQLDTINQTLKNKRIEMAMVDKKISTIHDEMKNALENSFYLNDPDKEDEWKWEISNSKMKSYMDVAQLKIRSKELYDEILENEQIVAKLKNDHISTQNLLSESERLNLKKIKNFEDVCTKLELQIAREKNELDEISNQVNELENFPHTHGNRIETLKEELKRFKEQEAEHSLVLNDLDRSISSIKEQSDLILKTHNNINGNSIALDYVANLGLLMDPDLTLNLLPALQKKDLQYFRPNQMLQKALLGIVMIFSIGAFANRSEIKPLQDRLPIKQSELSLMSMRRDMQSVILDKNSVVNNFRDYLNNDKYVSSNIVGLLQYISKTIPRDFHVTNLDINNSDFNFHEENNDFNYSRIKIDFTGFYQKNLEKSSVKADKLRNELNRNGIFKEIKIGPGKKLNKSKTQFLISMVF